MDGSDWSFPLHFPLLQLTFYTFFPEITDRSRINEIQEDWKPTFLTNEEFTHLVLEAVDGFIMVFSTSGHIYYASESIASLLGHLPVSTNLNFTLNFLLGSIFPLHCSTEIN